MNFRRLYLRLTYDIWRRLLPRYVSSEEPLRILECGTGPGVLLSFLEGWFPRARLFGLDIDLGALGQSRETARRAQHLQASAEALPFPAEAFDLIISLHMVEHLREPERFLKEAFRVLRPGGVLVLATPNPEGVGARVMGARWGGWTPEHLSLKSPQRWREALTGQGFTILKSGTTGLSGIGLFRTLPLGLCNWGLLFICGFFPWRHGEAFICLARKGAEQADATPDHHWLKGCRKSQHNPGWEE